MTVSLLALCRKVEPDTRCVSAHDRCYYGGPCPYCEVICHRDDNGRFARPPGQQVPAADMAAV